MPILRMGGAGQREPPARGIPRSAEEVQLRRRIGGVRAPALSRPWRDAVAGGRDDRIVAGVRRQGQRGHG